jgi:hypothetical protein
MKRKLQRSIKHQIPNASRAKFLGAWRLEFLRSLKVGAWSF